MDNRLLLVVFVQLGAVCIGSKELNTDSDAFQEFLTLYGKSYASGEEFERRFQIWQRNVDRISKHNDEASRGLHTYTMGINQFVDMTRDEYVETMLRYRSKRTIVAQEERLVYDKPLPKSADWKAQEERLVYDKPLPTSVDWKAKGYCTEVRNQGQCGSCWAFTATGALEGQHKKKTGVLVDLSEQNLMDCSENQGNQGCSGGLMDSSFVYVKENGGIDTEQSYPYNETDPGSYTCRYTKQNRGATCTGFVDLQKGNETALQEAVAFVGPIACAVDASHEGFEYYKSGVYDEPACSSTNIDHSLVIVGYGIENGKEFYNCKNSWGTTWGDEGYIKMVRNKNNQCGIATEASYPTI